MPAIASTNALPTSNRVLYRFIFTASVLFLIWFFGYDQWLKQDGRLDAVLCGHIAASGASFLRLLGFDSTVNAQQSNLILLNNQPAVSVGAPCNGLVLYALFAGFVAAFPGPWQRKLWYIPAGIIVIWFLNVLRVAALAINQHYYQRSADFNHHYTFTFIVYGFIFALWMLWARRLAVPASQSTSS
ncbi:archaeosortase/exosortase family protein [Hymenobacter sp. BT683]|uniref:Archaeosortase/exosortase family protein n=1 Tax=Hymenobacter jeongseonensis TaxID=2791027 RepID=A0ABS0IDH1_9BACT|nr:archaeosortase/exosortase family protein [Hymenobacter jeongseonensis]MBF9236365.1 archaeosortase/exosortase family protein [Hymenobacter jeongseonensis]